MVMRAAIRLSVAAILIYGSVGGKVHIQEDGSIPEWCGFRSAYPRQYVTYKVDKADAPVIDGNINDKAWQEAAWTQDFVDIRGVGPWAPPRYRTRSKVRWDEEYLYVAGEVEEPQIWANLTKHDTVIFHDNDFEVFINPDGTNHFYKEYEMNANNAFWDLCLNRPYDNHGYENSSRVFGKHGWDDPGLKRGVKVEGCQINDPDSGPCKRWTTEIAFPLAAINYNETTPLPTTGKYWRINFSRVEWNVTACPGDECAPAHYRKLSNTADNWVWQPTGIVDIHEPELWGYLQFADGPVGETREVRDPDWTIRHIAMELYYAMTSYYILNKEYTTDLKKLMPLCPVPAVLNGTCSHIPKIFVDGTAQHWTGHILSLGDDRVASIDDTRYLTVHDKFATRW